MVTWSLVGVGFVLWKESEWIRDFPQQQLTEKHKTIRFSMKSSEALNDVMQ